MLSDKINLTEHCNKKHFQKVLAQQRRIAAKDQENVDQLKYLCNHVTREEAKTTRGAARGA